MALVTRKEQGFIYEDDFSTGINTRWELTPNIPSRAVYDGTKLNLKHGSSTLYLFLKELADIKEFVLDVKNVYNPTTDGDVGGITVYANSNDFIALEEYFDVATGTLEAFPWIRLVRDYNYYTAYWSNDGIVWNLIGTNTFDVLAPKIGLFIEGSTGINLGVESIRVIKSTLTTVGNLQAGTKVSLVDSLGTVIETLQCRTQETKVVFDMSDLPIPFIGRFVIDTGVDILEDTTNLKIYGGDFYNFEVSPEIVFHKGSDEYPLSNGLEEFLGYLVNSAPYEDCKITVRNPLPGTFSNVKVSLQQHNGTDHWDRLVDLAPDVSGAPGIWADSVTIPSILSATEKVVWARLKREYDVTLVTSQVYFSLKVTASYDPV